MIKYTSLLLVVFLFAGCAAPLKQETIVLTKPFNSEKAKKMLLPGSNQILGSALIRQQGGGIVTCAGNAVVLLPDTAYARERITHLYGNAISGINTRNSYKFVPDEANYRVFSKKTTCDAQGSFEFSNIADGDFFVVTTVIWKVGHSTQGGMLMKQVNVENNAKKKIVLTTN